MSENKESIPYDWRWWAEFNRQCNELTPEDIKSMSPEPEDWEQEEIQALRQAEKDVISGKTQKRRK